MARQRSVVIASAVSAVLVTASAAIALATGLVGSTPADAVGSFEHLATVPRAPQASASATAATTAPLPAVARSTDDGGQSGPRGRASDDAALAPTSVPSATLPPSSNTPGADQPAHEDDPVVTTPGASTTTVAERHDGGTDHVTEPGEHERRSPADDGHEDDD